LIIIVAERKKKTKYQKRVKEGSLRRQREINRKKYLKRGDIMSLFLD
jgi:hypothetical protein